MAVSPATEAAPLLLPGLLSAVKSIKQHIQKTHANKNQEEEKKANKLKNPKLYKCICCMKSLPLGQAFSRGLGKQQQDPGEPGR